MNNIKSIPISPEEQAAKQFLKKLFFFFYIFLFLTIIIDKTLNCH